MKSIAIIGLGYVGLPLAVEFGKNRKVVGFDINKARVKQLQQGHDHTNECSEIELSQAVNLCYTSEVSDISECQIYIVTVPTPIDEAFRPDLKPLIAASKTVAGILKKGDIVIYESTVFPGATEEVCVPVLESHSGLVYNEDFFCGYSPERINPGDKVNTLTKIKKVTSGSTGPVADEVDQLYKSIITAGTWQASSIKVAEAAKVIENAQRDINIAFVNELSIIFERLSIDTSEVLEAAGSKWNFLPFKPGLVGGHCIGVDPYYLTHKAETVGYHPEVILSGRRINDGMASYAANAIVKKMVETGSELSGATVGVFGVTFKENCPDIRNSKVVDLIEELTTWCIDVKVVDPHADPAEVKAEYGIDLVDMYDLKNLSAIIVAVGHTEFYTLSGEMFVEMCKEKGAVFGDLKSTFDRKELEKCGFNVFRL